LIRSIRFTDLLCDKRAEPLQLKITLQQAAVPPLAGFPVRNFNRSIIRSLTPQQAAGNALANAVQIATSDAFQDGEEVLIEEKTPFGELKNRALVA